MRKEASYFEGKQAVLVYIARKLRDALRLESLLSGGGVDYGVEADHYHGGVIFRRQRVGAFFYVLPESVPMAHRIMQDHGFSPFVGL